jgi:AraC-like DNA-binding protein
VLEGSIKLGNPYFKSVFQKIHCESKINDNTTQLSVDGLLLQSFANIIRDAKHKERGVPGWVATVKELLHAGTGNITLGEIALETGIHAAHLSKEFPRYFNMGFGEYIRTRRVGRAAELLTDETLSLTAIAYQCGFADQSHFTRCFKAIYGMPPVQYRKKAGKH